MLHIMVIYLLKVWLLEDMLYIIYNLPLRWDHTVGTFYVIVFHFV
jgi:hypothetical protein